MRVDKLHMKPHVATYKDGVVFADFGQWQLGGELDGVPVMFGYVQKKTGAIQLIRRVDADAKRCIIDWVNNETGQNVKDAGMPVELPETEDGEDDWDS